MRKIICMAAAIAFFIGCGVPAITSSMRSNDFAAGSTLEGKCVNVDRFDLEDKVPELYKKGWRIAYVSEYTSTKRAGYPTVVCFERSR